jgi:hypothetical protein
LWWKVFIINWQIIIILLSFLLRQVLTLLWKDISWSRESYFGGTSYRLGKEYYKAYIYIKVLTSSESMIHSFSSNNNMDTPPYFRVNHAPNLCLLC